MICVWKRERVVSCIFGQESGGLFIGRGEW